MKAPKAESRHKTQLASPQRSSNALEEVVPFSLSDYIHSSDTNTALAVGRQLGDECRMMPISKAPPHPQQLLHMSQGRMNPPGVIIPWWKNNPLIDIENPGRESWRVEDPNDYPFGLYVNPKDLQLPPKPPPEEKKSPARRGRPPASSSRRKREAAPDDETKVGRRSRVSSPVKKSTKPTPEPTRSNPWRSCRG